MTEKTIELICATCSITFTKVFREHKRQLKAGRDRFFCSMNCAAIKNNEENPREGNPANLIANNRRDEFTSFKWFVNHAKSRNNGRKNKRDFNITPTYLKNLWESQKGTCPFAGWELILPSDSEGHLKFSPNNASLDRIDNAQGYVENNVRFVSVMANFARNRFTDDQLITFCKAVANQ